MRWSGSFQVAVRRLVAAGCVAAPLEAAELVAAAPDAATLDAWLVRRERGEPLAWITGTVRFCGRTLHVVPGVYVPRPQTEDLARRAAALLPAGGRALDLCTGAGAVAAHVAARVPGAAITGVDLDQRAAACARANGVPSVVGDLTGPVGRGAPFDVVTAVPPYVPTGSLALLPNDVRRYEPRVALDGGSDGLELVRRVITGAAGVLRRGGWLLIEIGGDQGDAVARQLVAAGFERISCWHDRHGDLRGVVAQWLP